MWLTELKSALKMSPSWYAIIYLALQFMDMISTYLCLEKGLEESNLEMAPIFNHQPALAVIIKITVPLITGVIPLEILRYSLKSQAQQIGLKMTYVLLITLCAMAVTNNFTLFFLHL